MLDGCEGRGIASQKGMLGTSGLRSLLAKEERDLSHSENAVNVTGQNTQWIQEHLESEMTESPMLSCDHVAHGAEQHADQPWWPANSQGWASSAELVWSWDFAEHQRQSALDPRFFVS